MQGEGSDGNGQESWQRLDEFRRRPDNLTTKEGLSVQNHPEANNCR